MDTGKPSTCSRAKFACPICSYSLPELEPRLFSFNSPVGACPSCDGLGQVQFVRPGARGRLPDAEPRGRRGQGLGPPQRLLLLDAARAWPRTTASTSTRRSRRCPTTVREVLLQRLGRGDDRVHATVEGSGKARQRSSREHPFEGILPNFERRFKETDSAAVREELARYQNAQACPTCDGTRLRREARNVFLRRHRVRRSDKAIYEISTCDAVRQPRLLRAAAARGREAPRSPTRSCARSRAGSRSSTTSASNYLSLDRSADTLSGGEAQRIRLASQIGSGLTGVMYVLDEPSIGLHQRDNDRLIATLRHLRDLGNSVLVVEHDEDMIRAVRLLHRHGPGRRRPRRPGDRAGHARRGRGATRDR